MKEIQLREYQESAIEDVRSSMRLGNRKVILMIPTGGGKTRIAAKMIKSIIENGKKVLFICDRIVLIDQTLKAFEEFDIPCGVIQGQHEKYEPHQPLQICSIQTLSRRRTPDADIIIADEIQTIYKAQVKIMDEWDNVKFIGLSATPFTKGLGKIWDDLIIGATTQELIDLKFLSPFEIYGAPEIDLKKVKMQAGDYNQKQLGEAVNKKTIVGDIIKHWIRHGEDRQTICFAVNILHSKHIVDRFNKSGVTAEHIDCFTKSEDRERIYKDFTDKKIRILSSVDILSKGFDEPQVSCLIMSRPTKSLSVFIQQFGRSLRICNGKKNAIILDHAGNTQRHGFPTDPLPQVLCNDDKKDSEKSEKKESLPTPCKKCFFIKPPKIHACPKCGYAPERQNEVENTDDTLIKIDKVETSEKLKWYSMLLYYARSKGYKDGFAAHAYKQRMGVWPFKKTGIHPIPPDDEVKKYIKYLIIRKARAGK